MIFVYTCTICVDSWNQLKTKFKVFFEPFLFRFEGVDISFHKPKWGYNQLIYGRGLFTSFIEDGPGIELSNMN